MQAIALIHEEDGVYGVSFPDFPGAITTGSTPDEALAKAAEVLAFHVEGLAEDGDVPAPRTLAQLKADPAFVRDAKDATVAFVPYSPPTKSVRVNMTFDEGLLDRVDKVATAIGETRSGFFAKAARARMMAAATIDARMVDDIVHGHDGSFQSQVSEPRVPERKRA